MRFYFVEVSYAQNPIIWEMGNNSVSARGVRVFELAKSELTEITDFDATKLSGQDGSIIIEQSSFVIPDVAEYMKKHGYKQIMYGSLSAKSDGKLDQKEKIAPQESKQPSRTFALSSLLPQNMKHSSFWGTTMASLSLNSKQAHELSYYRNLPIIVEQQLLMLKTQEGIAAISYFRSQRLIIISELIASYFEQFLNILSEAQYFAISEFIIKAVGLLCCDERLDFPLDHEHHYPNQDALGSSKEYSELMDASRKIEIARARLIAAPLSFEKLPGIIRVLILKMNLKKSYLTTHEQLITNILETGRKRRLNKVTIEEFQGGLHNQSTAESEYIKLTFFLRQVFPQPEGQKSKYTWEACETLLVMKIAQAIILLDENREKKEIKTLINYGCVSRASFQENPRLLIKANQQQSLASLLRGELCPVQSKDFYKELHHKIRDCKTEKMMELLTAWWDQSNLVLAKSPV